MEDGVCGYGFNILAVGPVSNCRERRGGDAGEVVVALFTARFRREEEACYCLYHGVVLSDMEQLHRIPRADYVNHPVYGKLLGRPAVRDHIRALRIFLPEFFCQMRLAFLTRRRQGGVCCLTCLRDLPVQ